MTKINVEDFVSELQHTLIMDDTQFTPEFFQEQMEGKPLILVVPLEGKHYTLPKSLLDKLDQVADKKGLTLLGVEISVKSDGLPLGYPINSTDYSVVHLRLYKRFVLRFIEKEE